MEPTIMEKIILNKLVKELCDRGIDKVAKGKTRFYSWQCEQDMLPFDVNSGCTKLVFLSDKCPNWVIKVPYGSKDYCAIEATHYQKALEEEVSCYFAATYFLCESAGVSFYIQERVQDSIDEIESIFYEYMEKQIPRENYEDEEHWSDAVSSAVCEIYEDEAISALFPGMNDIMDFVIRHCINDLHSANFGFNANGYPVIIDFSGY